MCYKHAAQAGVTKQTLTVYYWILKFIKLSKKSFVTAKYSGIYKTVKKFICHSQITIVTTNSMSCYSQY